MAKHALLILKLILLSLCPAFNASCKETAPGRDSKQADPLPPVAEITGPTSAQAGDSIRLDGSGSYDPQALDLQYSWTCDDGGLSSSDSIELHPSKAGEILCSLLVISSAGLQDQAEWSVKISDTRAEWTFMVFLAGDNDLAANALEDINEMEVAGSTDQLHIVVEVDLPGASARRYRVERDDDPDSISSPVLESLGSIDSGDPQSVIDFVSWTAKRFPAHRYALVLWNHGEAWSIAPSSKGKSIAMDFSSGNEISIANGEYEQVLEASVQLLGNKLELVGMDACNMASWEIAQVSEPYARVYVASQDSEDFDGWAYDTTLADLVALPSMEATSLGESIALRFYETGDSTMSVTDLEALLSADASLDEFAQVMIDSEQSSSLLAWAAQRAQDFDSQDHDLVDLVTLVLERDLPDELREAGEDLLSSMEQAIVANYVTGERVRNAHGLSIFSPPTGYLPHEYSEASWSVEHLWDELLANAAGN